MKITWLGHSCFLIEEDEYKLVTDPYRDVAGYPDLHTEAHEILTSHEHFDHNFKEAVTILPKIKSPFKIRAVKGLFHDDQKGALRGQNTAYVIEAGGIKVVHLGDLGHQLSPEKASEIGKCDVILIPVGGFFTIDGDGAAKVGESLGGGTLVPMHYRIGKYGFSNISELEPFLSHYKPEQIHKLSDNFFIAEKASGTKVVIPAFKE